MGNDLTRLLAPTALPQPAGNSTHPGLPLQRKCACGSPTSSLTGECGQCNGKQRLQAKLVMGTSNDALEQEADRVADSVLAAPAHFELGSARPPIQRFTGRASAPAAAAPVSVDGVLASHGRPMDAALRQDMEQRFGHDFSRVRVHTDTASEKSARDLNAHAYTAGHDIVFGASRFAPGTHEGRRLLAHELVHVMQQRSTCSPYPTRIQRQPDEKAPKEDPPRKKPAEEPPKKQPAGKKSPTLKSEGVDLGDPVAGNTAAIIDAVLTRNQKLAPYIGDRLAAGFRISEKGKFVQDSTDGNFDDAYRKAYELDSSRTVAKDTKGFFDSGKSEVHLRPDAKFGTALHESVHRLASPGLYKTYLPEANRISSDLTEVLKEGVTAFFTDLILKDEELPNFNDAYRSEKKKAETLIKALGADGFDLIAKFNFKGTGIIEIGEKLGFTRRQFGASKGGGVREVLKRMKDAM